MKAKRKDKDTDTIIAACVLTVHGDDGSVEVDHPYYVNDEDMVSECETVAKDKAKNYDSDEREFGAATDAFYVVTCDQSGNFDFNQIEAEDN